MPSNKKTEEGIAFVRYLAKAYGVRAQHPGPEWVAPNIHEEHEEFGRMHESGMGHKTKLMQAAKGGKLEHVTWNDPRWATAQNLDASKPLSIEDAHKKAKTYGKDIGSVVDGFNNRAKMPAPIVMKRRDGTWYGVAGNTRSMVSRAMGTPMAVWTFDEP